MLQNYLKISWRNIFDNRSYSIINVLGLTIGLSAAALLTLYAYYELSYDQFHSESDRIYRLTHTRIIEGEEQYSSATSFPELGLELANNFEAIEQVARLFDVSSQFIPVFNFTDSNGHIKSFSESPVYLADSTLLDVFDLRFAHPPASNPLAKKNTLVISKSLALRVFNSTDVVGKVLEWKGLGSYEITGVFEDIPANSHVKFEILSSWFNAYGQKSLKRWDGFYNYLLLSKHADLGDVQRQAQEFSNEYLSDYNEPRGLTSIIDFQPLTSIHLNSALEGEHEINGDANITYGLLIIALFILLLAIINYINLATSRAIERAKEVGVRKVIGSRKSQLMGQFLLESFLIVCLSTILTITCIQTTLPYFNDWLDIHITFQYWSLPAFWLIAILAVILLTLASGLYPAVIMARFKPISLIKGGTNTGQKSRLRSILLTIQFAISLFLIAGTLIVVQQVKFLNGKETGFNKDQVLVVNLFELLTDFSDSTYLPKLETLKDRLTAYSPIQAATVTSDVPGKEISWRGTNETADEQRVVSYRTRVDADFNEVYKIPLLAGRFFDQEDEKQGKYQLVVNSTWVQAMGFDSEKDAVGQKVPMGQDHEIIGVLQDFHQLSPKLAVEPTIFTLGIGQKTYLSVALNSEVYREAINIVRNEWQKSFPDKPFEYFLLDDHFEAQLKADITASEAISSFALLSIFLACLGMIGLSTNMAQQRSKELGIRKVLGASVLR